MKLHEMIRLTQEYHTTVEAILRLPWDRPWRRLSASTRPRARGRRRSG
jgi:hypothetical protein